MATGTVKWFDPEKGYGILTDQEGRDVFVHFSAISGTGPRRLEADQRVRFDVEEGLRGPRATKVVPLGDE